MESPYPNSVNLYQIFLFIDYSFSKITKMAQIVKLVPNSAYLKVLNISKHKNISNLAIVVAKINNVPNMAKMFRFKHDNSFFKCSEYI